MSLGDLLDFASSFYHVFGIDVRLAPPKVSLSLSNLSLKSPPPCPASRFGVLLILYLAAPGEDDIPSSVPSEQQLWDSDDCITDDTTTTNQMYSASASCDFLTLTPIKKLVFRFDVDNNKLLDPWERNETWTKLNDPPLLDVFIVGRNGANIIGVVAALCYCIG
ncbi:hypothetical protein RIF29_41878 [Crotalaria pallida]|uniref:Uncharacterized protein n=1 Tax=Crotalaria pallida TaxID=3830 RepID=A0AAN9E5X1_CROPI